MRLIYLDNASTTKVYKQVIKRLIPYLNKEYGNPSSPHELGERAKKAISQARTSLAKELNAKPNEIIFTSGATESNNLAIQGLARSFPAKKTIIISNIEHPSINEVCNYLNTQNYNIIKIPVDNEGLINLENLEKEIKSNQNDILLVSIMHVNNIIGTIQDIEKIGIICKLNNVPFHTDAVQSFGKIKIDVKKSNISLLSASGHKIGAPKGIGLLYLNEKINISPIIYGGGQERNIRSGAENVPGIMGMAKALEMSKKIDKNKIKKIRDELIKNLEKLGAVINGSKENRLYNNIHASFNNIEAESLIHYLSKKGIYISTGSACDSKKEKEDHVLKAINLNNIDIPSNLVTLQSGISNRHSRTKGSTINGNVYNQIKGSIRISLNEDISEKDIYLVTKEIEKALKLLKVR